jgi:hypothetical protein
MAKNKNERSQRQFRGPAPQESVDEWDRTRRIEPSSPSKSRSRDSIAKGFQTQARPGLVGDSDYKRGKRGR